MKKRQFELGDLCTILSSSNINFTNAFPGLACTHGVIIGYEFPLYPHHDYNKFLVYSNGQCDWHPVYRLRKYIET